jgi:hypothetical protein
LLGCILIVGLDSRFSCEFFSGFFRGASSGFTSGISGGFVASGLAFFSEGFILWGLVTDGLVVTGLLSEALTFASGLIGLMISVSTGSAT